MQILSVMFGRNDRSLNERFSLAVVVCGIVSLFYHNQQHIKTSSVGTRFSPYVGSLRALATSQLTRCQAGRVTDLDTPNSVCEKACHNCNKREMPLQ